MKYDLNPPDRILMGPGPSNVSSKVLEAQAKPVIGHLDPEFIKIMNEVADMLRLLFGTKNILTLPISATGSAGMETVCVNLLEEGDNALICVMVYLGHVWLMLLKGVVQTLLNLKHLGKIIEPDDVKCALRIKNINL